MTASADEIDFARSRAVIIGTSKYSAGFGGVRMQAALNSLDAMRSALIDACSWPAERISAFPDPGTGDNVLFAVAPLIREATDVLLIYYVGHGQLLPGNDLGLALTDTSQEPSLRALTSLRLSTLREEIDLYCTARIKILILDCCMSGIATKYFRDPVSVPPRSGAHHGRPTGMYVLTACGHAQDTYFEDGEHGLTYFTKFLTEILRTDSGPAGQADLTMVDLHREIAQRFRQAPPSDASPVPEPDLLIHGSDGGFAFTRGAVRTGRLVCADDQIELIRLFRRWPATVVFHLYPTVVGPAGRPLDADCRDVAGVFRLLAEQERRPDQMPPLIELAEWQASAAEELKPDSGEALRAWVEQVAARLGISRASLAALREEIRKNRAHLAPRSHLLVRIDPYGVRDGGYLPTVLLYRNGAEDPEPLPVPPNPRAGDEDPGSAPYSRSRPYTLAEIRELISNKMRDWERTVDRRRLTVEFLVPRELLSEEFDQWPVRIGKSSLYPLGAVYQVVARDLDRLADEGSHEEWRRRWDRIEGSTGIYQWVNPTGQHIPGLFNELYDAEQCVCLALTSPPAHRVGTPQHAWDVAVDAGVPAALWSRAVEDDTVGQMERLLDRGPLAMLPERVRRLRGSTVSGSGRSGTHLTLVWDDPARKPFSGSVLEPPPNGIKGISQ